MYHLRLLSEHNTNNNQGTTMYLFFLRFYPHFRIAFTCALLTVCSQTHAVAPDIELEGVDGNRHNLNEYIGKGKWTALNIWGARCPPCLEEMPELVHFHDDNKNSNAIVVGVAIDFPSYGYADRNEVIEFIDEHLIDFPVLLSDAGITERIGTGRLEGIPTTYLYTPAGELAAMQVGGVTRNMLEAFIRKYQHKTNSSSDIENKNSE
jgi:thiol-disulfide isomerase/thioredoxin